MAVKKKSTKKKTSRVNEAGNYTKPTMRKNLFNRIKAGSKGGKPGQWSARKAQMLAKEYKAKGGGYKQEDIAMPMGKGTYGSQKGRPSKKDDKKKMMMGGMNKKKGMMGGGKMKYSMGGEVAKPN